LQACLTLQSIQQDMEQQAAVEGSEAGAAALTPAQRAAISAARRSEALQRFTAGWLRLQNEVNALIDSTTAENTDQAVRGYALFQFNLPQTSVLVTEQFTQLLLC
jgi:hypothetical protein